MIDRERVIEHIADYVSIADCQINHNLVFVKTEILKDVLALLKAQEPCEDWISRKRLKDEIQYYIDEAGWSEDVNKVLGWCMEFIDNQKVVTWNDA